MPILILMKFKEFDNETYSIIKAKFSQNLLIEFATPEQVYNRATAHFLTALISIFSARLFIYLRETKYLI